MEIAESSRSDNETNAGITCTPPPFTSAFALRAQSGCRLSVMLMRGAGHGGKIPDFSGTGIVHVLQYCSDNDCDSDDEPSTMYT